MLTLNNVYIAIRGEWYLYLPQITAIYFVIISPLCNRVLEQSIRNMNLRAMGTPDTDAELLAKSVSSFKDLLVAIASDWASRVNFINAIFASLVAGALIVVRSHVDGELAFFTLFVIFVIFFAIIWWVYGIPFGQLSTRRTRPRWITLRQMITYGNIIRIILLSLNIFLIVITFLI